MLLQHARRCHASGRALLKCSTRTFHVVPVQHSGHQLRALLPAASKSEPIAKAADVTPPPQMKSAVYRQASDPEPENSLPLITLEELSSHTSEASCWVALGGIVYDVTEFVREHPGGAEAVLGAGGQDLEGFWAQYRVHFNGEAMAALSRCHKVGRLSAADVQQLASTNDKKSVARAETRSRRRLLRVALVGLSGPLWSLARMVLSLIGRAMPSVTTTRALAVVVVPPACCGYCVLLHNLYLRLSYACRCERYR